MPRVEFAPAKINLALHVTGQRADGYHLLESLAVFTRFGDRISIEPAERDEFAVSGPYAPAVPTDETNLILKARDALRGVSPSAKTVPVVIRLDKNLPIASGIGGGSSDAAAALRGLVKFWDLDVGHETLTRIGAALGADLPMCLAAKPLLARGTGDELSPVRGFPALGLVLVNPDVAVSTPAVFAALQRRDNDRLPPLPSRHRFPHAPQLVGNHPQRSRGCRASDRTVDPRGQGCAHEGRCRLCPYVGFRRHLLRPVRDGQCGQARRRRDPQPPPRLVRRRNEKHAVGRGK